ncbi:hypothetical protein ONE63_008394 [Megalurothrips usitatus]|uniref:Dynein assembly factor 5, axonemal n=1 Tax=Megalurothrips usitatus TaxID=439358 RepID=A0AAV7XL06_9NEOP|nr:hypothetical protein ONE63_008394 [Megalurothrips usitatus]
MSSPHASLSACSVNVVEMSVIEDPLIDNAVLQRTLNGLQSEERRKRKLAIDELRKCLLSRLVKSPTLLRDHEDVLKAILRCVSDQSEACRESSVNLLKEILLGNAIVNLSLVMPVLSARLGSDEVVESSEEVRLASVELLHFVIKRAQKEILPFFNDIITILKKTILDPYPKIKKESCECASSLALTIPENFHMQSESLIKPLIQISTHQQYRVRVSAILAVGKVVQFGNNKSIKDVSGPLAERLFDQSPQVRESVTEIVGNWLVDLPDRYSYFHIMIPLMLTSLNDQSPDIQEKAWDLWNEAGEKWKKENEDDIKDKMDFLDCLPDHYPAKLRRPNIGCRTLVKRNLHKIAPALVRELEDWLVDVRIKASQLLCVLILNAETDLHQYVEQLLVGMYRACNDEDPRVVSNIERASQIMGYFVPPTNYWTLMHPVMEDSCHQGHLRVLASVMSGAQQSDLLAFSPTVARFLHQPSICRSREASYQSQLIKCCCAIMDICGQDCVNVSQELFNILVTVLALAGSDIILENAQAALQKLQNYEGFQDINDLYRKYMRQLLEDVSSAPQLWTIHCPERLIFQSVIVNCGQALSDCLDIMMSTLSASLQPENQDAEMKLKLLSTVAVILQNADRTHSIPANLMDPFILSFIKDVIAPNLIWKAGRTAEALRTITVSCLLAILQTHGVTQNEAIIYLLDSLLPVILALVEDSARKTRLYSLRSLSHITNVAHVNKILNAEHVNKLYAVIMKRLDDVDDSVRRAAVQILCKLFSHLPDDYNVECSAAHIEAVYSTLLIHLDDPNIEFGREILGVLKELSGLKPKCLLDRVNAIQSSFRNQQACGDLALYISSNYLSKTESHD